MLVAIRSVDGERVPKMMRWGLVPHWAKDDNLQYSTFNARAEDFTIKPRISRLMEMGPAVFGCH
jgi:putative SOS response-associated peptidase YedK